MSAITALMASQARQTDGFVASLSVDRSNALPTGKGHEPNSSPSAPQVESSATTGCVSSGLLFAADHLQGQRIPLDHIVQTSLAWGNPRLYSAEPGENPRNFAYWCPPRIEWSSKSHEKEQQGHRQSAEKEMYARFLDFGELAM